MSTTTTFEDEVRAMLTRRAADVLDDPAGAVPPLPTGLRIPLVPEPGRPTGRAWSAVAAAAVVVLGAVGLVARAGDGDATERTAPTEAAPTTEAPGAPEPRPLQLDSLPVGVDPTTGPLLGLGAPAATPEVAMTGVLGPLLGLDVGPAIPYSWLEGALPEDRWAAYWYPTVPVEEGAWADTDPDARSGSVVARHGDGGWNVVAVTSQALDLRAVRRDGGGLAGSVWATSAAPLRATVTTLDGEVLGDAALATVPGTGPGTDPGARSVLSLDDLEVDAGDQPVAVVVEAGDRPGQVGIGGVRAAAVSAVVLPAASDEGAAGPGAAEPTTTTAGPPPDTAGPVIGVGHRPLPLDAPVVTSVAALLPPGTAIGRAEHTYVAKPGSNDDVVVREAEEGGGPGYSVLISRTGRVSPGEETPTPVAWGTVWVGAATEEPTSAEDGTTSIWARSSAGVAVRVQHRAAGGPAVTAEALVAIAERLVADPVVRSVAAGGDPRGF